MEYSEFFDVRNIYLIKMRSCYDIDNVIYNIMNIEKKIYFITKFGWSRGGPRWHVIKMLVFLRLNTFMHIAYIRVGSNKVNREK